jgi:hypothetical protein
VPIVLGILVATLLNHALAGSVGSVLARLVDPQTMRWILGLSFVAMAVWMLIPDKYEEQQAKPPPFGVFATTLFAFCVANRSCGLRRRIRCDRRRGADRRCPEFHIGWPLYIEQGVGQLIGTARKCVAVGKASLPSCLRSALTRIGYTVSAQVSRHPAGRRASAGRDFLSQPRYFGFQAIPA